METRLVLLEIGKRIASRRKELHMTQDMLADRMDVSTQTISYIETGKKGIRPENLIRLCSALEVSADYILTGNVSTLVYDKITERISRLTPEQVSYMTNIIDNSLKLIETTKQE